MLSSTAAVRSLIAYNAAEGSCNSLKQVLQMCSLAALPLAAVLQSDSASIDSKLAEQYTECIRNVAPELLNKSKVFNLVSAVYRKFGRSQSQGPPKAKTHIDGSVYKCHVPEIAWMDTSQLDASPAAGHPSSVRGFFAATTDAPSSTSIWQRPARDMQVHADGPAKASEVLRISLLHEWMEAGLLQRTGNTLAVPSSRQPLPVRIPATDSTESVYYRSHVEDTMLSMLISRAWTGPTHVIASHEQAQDVVKQILDRASQCSDPRERVLGFDVEFKPRWNNSLPESPPTVIQVATSTEVYVFHVKHFAAGVRVGANPAIVGRALQPLVPLFTTNDVLKVGIGVHGDTALLQKFIPNMKFISGFHDMSPIAQGAGLKRNSLRALSALLLGHSINKSQQKSNWDKSKLSESQVSYAATDAWVSREIALKLAPLWLPKADIGS